MKHRSAIIILATCALMVCGCSKKNESTRYERRYVAEGNAKYSAGKYQEALDLYEKALRDNDRSTPALYNAALTRFRLWEQTDTTSNDSEEKEKQKEQLHSLGINGMQSVAASNTPLASWAHYNLGNATFNGGSQDKSSITEAMEYYKMALRIDPSDDDARHNLRLLQKMLDQNQDNQDQNQNQDQQDNQDNQDNKDQQDKQDQEQQQQQQQQQQNRIDPSTADRIMKAQEEKEAQRRLSNIQKQHNQRNPRPKNW